MCFFTHSLSLPLENKAEKRGWRDLQHYMAYCMMRCYLKAVFCGQEKSSVILTQKKKREVKCYCDIPTLEAELLLGLLLDFDLK